MRVEFEWGSHNLTLTTPLVEIVAVQSWEKDSHAHPTAEEKAACPSTFRCYVCLERKTSSHLGGKLAGKWICRECYRHQDKWDVGCLILFDRQHTKDKATTGMSSSRKVTQKVVLRKRKGRRLWR